MDELSPEENLHSQAGDPGWDSALQCLRGAERKDPKKENAKGKSEKGGRELEEIWSHRPRDRPYRGGDSGVRSALTSMVQVHFQELAGLPGRDMLGKLTMSGSCLKMQTNLITSLL